MKKQMKRTVYEAPRTERTQVQLEGSFMTASAEVQNPNTENGKIEEHATNTDFSADFGATGWD